MSNVVQIVKPSVTSGYINELLLTVWSGNQCHKLFMEDRFQIVAVGLFVGFVDYKMNIKKHQSYPFTSLDVVDWCWKTKATCLMNLFLYGTDQTI